MVVLVLVGAYRALGGAPPKAGDSTALLSSLQAQLRRSLVALSAQLDSASAAGDLAENADAARDGRKLAVAVQQTLDALPPSTALDSGDATARTLLAAAAEDTAWAWRMLQAAPVSPAIAAAATLLAGHAAECCDQAEPLLAGPLSGEPRDGP